MTHLSARMLTEKIKIGVILNAAAAGKVAGRRGVKDPEECNVGARTHALHSTGCFDSVPSTACAHDGTPLSMTTF
jgi:hypothetical protein